MGVVRVSDVDDRREVAALLGREPGGAFEVVVRHRDGSPLVIANAPFLDDGTPMPTRFWLVGEPERTWIGQLESTGAVDRVETELGEDVIADAHLRYAAMRDALIPTDHEGPRPFGGVGGTRVGVKCLHAHYAWLLAGGDDPVGRWVADRLAEAGHVSEVLDVGSIRRPSAQSGDVVAAIDCGTNSTRLLVARRAADGSLESLERLMKITRLGQDVDRTHRLAPEAIRRTVDVLRSYREVMDRLGAVRVRATATSAARDAANSDEFFDAAEAVLGTRPELIAGTEEGALSFAGATADLSVDDGPFLVVDIGGGSTEFVAGSIHPTGSDHLTGVESLNVGCVRITERFLSSDPPTPSEIEAATATLDDIVSGVLDRVEGARTARTLVGLAGTVSTLASVDLGLDRYDRERVHHHIITAATVEALTARLAAMTVVERRDVPGMEAARADVIVGGLLVLRAIVRALASSEVLVSEADILDGLAASLFI